jgi:hypothetical protein
MHEASTHDSCTDSPSGSEFNLIDVAPAYDYAP